MPLACVACVAFVPKRRGLPPMNPARHARSRDFLFCQRGNEGMHCVCSMGGQLNGPFVA